MAEQKEESVSFKISYWNFTGRGVPLRAAAFLGGVSFKDAFVSGPQHAQAKQDGTRRWSGLPEVTLYDKDGNETAVIGQSNVGLKLIGMLSGLYPENNVQAAFVDEVTTSTEDMIGVTKISETDEEKKKALQAALVTDKTKLPYWFGKFEARLVENEKRGNKNGYFVGDALTVADLKFFYTAGFFMDSKAPWGFDATPLLKECPKIKAFMDTMDANEDLKKFHALWEAKSAESKADDKAPQEHVYPGKNVYAPM